MPIPEPSNLRIGAHYRMPTGRTAQLKGNNHSMVTLKYVTGGDEVTLTRWFAQNHLERIDEAA